MLHVVACPRCRRARVVEAGKKTASCGTCGRPLDLPNLRAYHATADPEEARQAVGLVNARLARREDEFASTLVPADAPRAPRHDTPWEAAAAEARKATAETDRVDRLARALSALLGELTTADLTKAFGLAGIPATRLEDHLERMRLGNVLFEPRPGRYRAF